MKKRFQYIGMLSLAIALSLAITVIANIYLGKSTSCQTAQDCVGLSHVECEGHWECINGQCAWACVQTGPPPGECSSDPDCMTGGCSGQLCIPKSEADAGGGITTCEWREEYGCLKRYASCGCVDGVCKWSKSEKYQTCIDNISDSNERRIL